LNSSSFPGKLAKVSQASTLPRNKIQDYWSHALPLLSICNAFVFLTCSTILIFMSFFYVSWTYHVYVFFLRYFSISISVHSLMVLRSSFGAHDAQCETRYKNKNRKNRKKKKKKEKLSCSPRSNWLSWFDQKCFKI
jgi:hypothetical protein